MAYFNHAFTKTFLATGEDQTSTPVVLPNGTSTTASTVGGQLTTTGLPTVVLNQLSVAATSKLTNGYIGLFDADTQTSVTGASLAEDSVCCNVILAGSTIYSNDKIGPFHGGYQETNKSKMINPKYVSRLYDSPACPAQNEIVHVGSTYFTAGGGVEALDLLSLVGGTGYAPAPGTLITTVTGGTGTGAVVQVTISALGVVTAVVIIAPGKDYTIGDTLTIVGGNDDATIEVQRVGTAAGGADCCKEFLCDETYSLRLDIKGSPALRFLNRNSYFTADFYTGCCADETVSPEPVDSTLVMIGWAQQFLNSPLIRPFVSILVVDQTGTIWYPPSTPAAQLPAGFDTWDNYVSPGYTTDACAGLIIAGAYVDTRFGDCTFQTSDFFEKEPVRLYISEVDYNGDPCTFGGICVETECESRQANGFGEQAVRNLIMSESYRQNFFHSDLRIREITQGNQELDVIDRGALYDRVYLQHNVPRFNNPTGVFDNDQYLLEIILEEGNAASVFEDFATWLEACGVCKIESFTCGALCENDLVFPTLPPLDLLQPPA
jgi:hypothetical protein